MNVRGTGMHILTGLLALGIASPVAAQDGGVLPGSCDGGGWGASINRPDLPANIPSFHVNLFGLQTDTGVVRLVRRTAGGDVVVDAEVTRVEVTGADVGTYHSYAVAPRQLLEPGVMHAFQWSSACIPTTEHTYTIGPAAPLPALPATLTATLIQTVRDGRRAERFVRVDLELSSDVLTWVDALAFDVVVDDIERTSLFLPYESTRVMRRQLFVECAGRREDRTPRVGEGEHAFRAEVGGFGGLEPALEVSTTQVIDCGAPLYLHALTEVPLTPAEIDALGAEVPPPVGEAGVGPDAAVISDRDSSVAAADGGVVMTPSSGGCSATPGRGTVSVWVAMLLGIVVRRVSLSPAPRS